MGDQDLRVHRVFSLNIFGFLQVGILNRVEAALELIAKGTADLKSSSCSRRCGLEKFDLCDAESGFRYLFVLGLLFSPKAT